MAEPKVYIGTSGWMYKHWNKFFYPEGLKGKDQLPYFAEHFNTVEINNSFYRIPKESAAQNWFAETPADFVFAIKLNQYLTHRKRLILDDDSRERLDWFLKATKPLKEKAKTLLVQLPPNFQANFERLDDFLVELDKKVPKGQQIACEFRHDSWLKDGLYEILRKHRAAFVIATQPGKFNGAYPITAKVVYIRYHATAEKPDYKEKELDKWAAYIKALPAEIRTVFVYFNNDFEGWAITNAEYLKKKLNIA